MLRVDRIQTPATNPASLPPRRAVQASTPRIAARRYAAANTPRCRTVVAPVEASDGVTDSAHERFLIRLENLPAGEHLLVIRVYDSAGNEGLAKLVIRKPAAR
jgi:hypothetical protein